MCCFRDHGQCALPPALAVDRLLRVDKSARVATALNLPTFCHAHHVLTGDDQVIQ